MKEASVQHGRQMGPRAGLSFLRIPCQKFGRFLAYEEEHEPLECGIPLGPGVLEFIVVVEDAPNAVHALIQLIYLFLRKATSDNALPYLFQHFSGSPGVG